VDHDSVFGHNGALNGSGRAARPVDVAIGPIVRVQQAREWTLVLDSMEVAYRLREERGRLYLVVDEKDYARALRAIDLYETENRNWPPRRLRERLPYPRTLTAPLVFLALVALYAFTGPAPDSGDHSLLLRGVSSSEKVMHGQIWRAVTALTLHGDVLHIAGNALGGSIFLGAVNRRLGDGRGTFAVLMSGVVGNLVNALWHRTGHLSIGASTAVFGAVGILAATQMAVDRRATQRSFWERVTPFVGGLALLGMLGASPHSDLLAHLFGFFAGLAIGLGFAWRRKGASSISTGRQVMYGLLALAIVAASWAIAISPIGA
jgi:membrane associated rhomboid family serine protease